ncbi:hypothetical protein [Mycobacterium asiaticum]|uniref:Tape measure protein n=1 Tax=Mycobacterium asiaticum TaxID=1790 RepID=A0A1A3MYD7_MYCAS|nr:hypothetical protein [Mycobacterium asiaticum]OBK14095.1 hypothetical protein A5635_10395 [Mycobacterium asiaticum]
MPDYSLGRAHGKIEIDYDGSGADRAAEGLDRVIASSDEADKSLTRTQRTLSDTDRQLSTSGSAADGYNARLREMRRASEDVAAAERNHQAVLRDSKSTLDEIEAAEKRVTEAKDRHIRATHAERDAHRSLQSEMNIGQRVVSAFSDLIPNLNSRMLQLGTTHTSVTEKTNALARVLGIAGKAVAFLGPEGKAASVGLEVAAKGVDKLSDSASSGSSHVRDFIRDLAQFELAFGKISGLALTLPSVGGLAGLGGASALQGIVEVIDAVRQLSGLLGLLPAAISGAAFSAGTLKVAFHGVGDAIKDMMADDPKKFLEDIAGMAPAAAQSMLQIAQFRDMFKLAGGAVQQSFFTKIAADIAPLIQTWLPAITTGMSTVAGIFGEFAHQFAGIMQQPATMAAFTGFVDNMAKGLQALQPALAPAVSIFTQLVSIGSSFFQQIGGNIAAFVQQFGNFINQAASNGSLQSWIQTGINAFGHLVHVVESVGSAFNTVMSVADRFGGGGLLGWLDKVTAEFDRWTQSAEGQQTLTSFFSTLQTATQAFLPMLKPLVEGVASIATAFTQLGIGIAPGWQAFFNAFASSMAQLGPQIVGMAPALNEFLTQLARNMVALAAQIGPSLPAIFKTLADAFVTLLPQIGPVVYAFSNLLLNVGPQLPALFQAVTDALFALIPIMPQIIVLIQAFVGALTIVVDVIKGVIDGVHWLNDALGKELPAAIRGIVDTIGNFFNDLPNKALEWGKNLIQGLVRGMTDGTGLGLIGNAAAQVVNGIAQWFQHSPAKVGPFSGSGYTKIRGQMMVQDMAAGMVSAQGAVAAAGASTAQAAAGGLAAGGRRAPTAGGAEGLGGALLPDNIANADSSILSAYLRHEFPENRGLKGLAKDLGAFVQSMQSGTNFLMQYGMQQVLQTLTSMPFGQKQSWSRIPADVFARQQAADLQNKAFQDANKNKVSWGDIGLPGGGAAGAGAGAASQQTPLGVTAQSSKQDIQRAIIAAGRARGMSDAAIQTALAVAAAESGFNPTISGGVQGSAGLVSGLYQQSPSSGWGTLDQVNNPEYAINAFYNAFAKALEKNPTDPLLAAVLTQNPQLGSGAQGSKYMGDVRNQLGLAGSILSTLGPGVKGPSWQDIQAGGAGGGVPAPVAPGSVTASGPLTYIDEVKGWVDGNGNVFRDQAGKNPTGQSWHGPGKVSNTPTAPAAAPTTTTAGAPINLPPGTKIGADGSLAFPHGVTPPANIPKLPPGTKIGADGSLSFPQGVTPPPSVAGAPGISGIGLNPASQATRVPIAPNVEAGIRAIGGLPGTLYPTSGAGAYQVPAWAQQLAAAFGLTASTYSNGGSLHQMGYAFDFNDPDAPNGPSQRKEAFARFIMQNLRDQTLQLIYRGSQDYGIASGQVQGQGQYYTGSGGYQEHTDHVHWGTDVPVLINGQIAPGSLVPTGLAAGVPGASATGLGNGVVLPNGRTVQDQLDIANQNLSVNDRLLQAYLAGNPALASQISAAQVPGAADQDVLAALNGIDTTIAGLQAQDAIGNKNTISALQSTQSQIAQNQGFQQGPNMLQTLSTVAGGASNAITSVIQAVQGGLDAMTATQDIADRLVYGLRNTEDVNKIIDNVQKYITFASEVAMATGSVLNMVGSMIGAGGSGDPSGGSQGAAMALSAAGQVAQLISGVLQGVNAAIDFGQQVYQIAGSYVGRFLSQLGAGALGTPLMGDVRFLLNKNTGQLISYSQDNPGNQNVKNVPGFLNQTYDYGGGYNANPGIGELNIYAGPGQSPHDMMSEAMWLVNTGATAGALAPANF